MQRYPNGYDVVRIKQSVKLYCETCATLVFRERTFAALLTDPMQRPVVLLQLAGYATTWKPEPRCTQHSRTAQSAEAVP
jgi:hypothetical protein